ncbi:APC family permease [Mycolicibacterium baixiangningiae]|uniref:APC family permease n=1 Tax=Mycolicibacterium baixiangningiae TaxID=2761578 RepID=UPI0018674C9A|nr:APC family permease [Mycolicibacterium baixiangningiae]
MTDTANQPPSGADDIGLEAGQVGKAGLVAMSISSFFPAVGIALVPFLMLSVTGPTGWLATVLAATVIILIGCAVVHFARRYVATGSLYSYIGEVFGPWSRYVTGAALLLGFASLLASLYLLFGVFVGSFLFSRGFEDAFSVGVQLSLGLVVLAISTGIAYRGLDTSVKVTITLAAVSVPLVAFISVVSAFKTGFDLSLQLDFSDFSIGDLLNATALVVAYLIGFESCAALAEETRDPKQSVPLAVMSVPVVLGGAFTVATVLQMPGLVASSEHLQQGMSAPAVVAMNAGLPGWVGEIADLLLAAAVLATLIAFVNYGSRFVLTLGKDGLLPRWTTVVHKAHHTPHFAQFTLSALAAVVAVAVTFYTGDTQKSYIIIAPVLVYAWVIPYALITLGVVVMAFRERRWPWLLMVASFLGGGGMIWTYVNSLVNPPEPPADAMSWITPVALVATILALGFVGRSRALREK